MMNERRGPHANDEAVSDYLARLASDELPESPRLPAAEVLWVKAQLLRRWEAERKAQSPLDVMEPVQILAGLAAAVVLFVWSIPSLLEALSLMRG